jgi:hypothetical protein
MGIDENVKQWLEDNPDCPSDIREWITRPPDKSPFVTEKDKRNFMRSHSYVKQMFAEMSKPHEVTKVNSIEEAIEVTVKDMNKGQKPN